MQPHRRHIARCCRRWAAVAAAALLAGCRHCAPTPLPDSPADREEAYRQIRLLTRAMAQIRKDYVDAEKTEYQALTYGALRGMLQSLDPHSQFMEPKVYEDMKDETAGEYGGIGVVIGLRDGGLAVIAPMEDTPGFRAGLQSGDRIMEIDGAKTDGLSLRDVVGKLRGEKGTSVTLKILRQTEKELREFQLMREVIRVSSVKGTRILGDGIGYIRITQFSEPTAKALDEALQKLTTNGLHALVLDLRNNPGGLLTSAIEVSERFLKKGDMVVFTRGRGGVQKQDAARARLARSHTGFPMAILVNEGSASASEIVAGALQDHKRAILVGERTFGKASVQSVFQLEDGSALRLTTAKYYTPSERVIHDKGIEPDIVVPMAPDEWQKVQVTRARAENPGMPRDPAQPTEAAEGTPDRQLERAVDLLKGILIFEHQQ